MKKPLRGKEEYLIGIDEAGRGPLAGPVAIGISFIPKQFQKEVFSFLKKSGLNDSKQVKEKTREELYEMLVIFKKEQKIKWEVMLVSAKVISKKGISHAISFGIQKGLEKLKIKTIEKNTTLELDGALKVPQGNWKKSSIIIKGDSIKPSIMIASILAKVTRDRHMKKLSKKYPQYNFEIHKGYGTQKHRDLIKKHGLSTEHRVGWYKV
jgi:ribonuclease HII